MEFELCAYFLLFAQILLNLLLVSVSRFGFRVSSFVFQASFSSSYMCSRMLPLFRFDFYVLSSNHALYLYV